MKQAVIGLTFLALVSACDMQKQNQETAGQPSPSVAMFAAQSDFTQNVCLDVPPSLERRADLTDKVRDGILMLDTYNRYPAFVQALSQSSKKYASAWAMMSAGDRVAYCSNYYQDLASVTPSMATIDAADLRTFFSPPSDAALKRQAVGGIALGAISVAASVGSVTQTNNGNFGAASRLNDVGQMTAQAIPDGSRNSAAYCPAYDHFKQFSAPVGHSVWKQYRSLRKCP